jgi:hypothetical protein
MSKRLSLKSKRIALVAAFGLGLAGSATMAFDGDGVASY